MTARRPALSVLTAAQAAARDTAAIDSGIPSRALMQRAGAAAAMLIVQRYAQPAGSGVCVFTGPGNNGGDGWVVARALAAGGARVRVCEVVEAKTPDARAERALALPAVTTGEWQGERLVVDALLGTGPTGVPHGPIAAAISRIATARAHEATVVALDVPSGLDATTGDAADSVTADLTITFGSVKRGQLVARGRCGALVVVDIGLPPPAPNDRVPALVDARWMAGAIPPVPAEAHKGLRKKLVILGGAEGMSGAAVLGARAAIRSGIGMVRLLVAPESLTAVQAAEPFALAAPWPSADDDNMRRELVDWADALVIGPGLGRSAAARQLVHAALSSFRGPVLLDADALNIFSGDLDAMAKLLRGRAALLTPHPAEFARLAATTVEEVLAHRFDVGAGVARRTGATVLLKGVPTVVTAADGAVMVSAAGTPILAAAGSGDILSGIAGTLLAQTGDALGAGAAAAWIHGTAAERAAGGGLPNEAVLFDADLDEDLGDEVSSAYAAGSAVDAAHSTRAVRGITLEDVLGALSSVWNDLLDVRGVSYPVLIELPAVGEAR